MSDFIGFDEFLKRTAMVPLEAHRAGTGTSVDSATFEEMRRHVLSMYWGRRALHSFLTADGQYVDCIPIDQQPSLQPDGTTAASIAEPPAAIQLPSSSSELSSSAAASTQPPEPIQSQVQPDRTDSFGNRRSCPSGTIPMRRLTLEEMTRFNSLNDFFQKKGKPKLNARTKGHPRLTALADEVPHRYAHGFQVLQNNGGSSLLNLWSPTPTPGNFSLSQHWYAGGSGTGLQTVEAGWQVYPNKYNVSKAVLFIYWTADGYQNTGNYNLDKPAFVQTNSSWIFGVGWADAGYSVSGGQQQEFCVHWQRDPSNGNWWLFLQGAGDLTAVGYYPRSLYGSGQLATFATDIDYGGEVTGLTSGQMGSGAFAGEGWQRAAYQRKIAYFPITGPSAWANLTPSAPTPSCYTIDMHNNEPGDWATYFYFGGPRCG